MLTIQQAAEQIGVVPQTVLGWIKSGLLPATRFGRQWMIDEADLAKAIADRKPVGRPPEQKKKKK